MVLTLQVRHAPAGRGGELGAVFHALHLRGRLLVHELGLLAEPVELGLADGVIAVGISAVAAVALEFLWKWVDRRLPA
ncbi:hypothetical protein ACWGLF_37105 [Streptomyces puniciscabiei]